MSMLHVPKIYRQLLPAVLALFVTSVAVAGSYRLKMEVGGVERVAKVVENSAGEGLAAPLVLAFHGYDDNPNNFSRHVDLHKSWPEAIIVYPQGLQIPDRDGTLRAKGWQSRQGLFGDRDLLYVDAILEELGSRHSIDPGRVYATGFSNGGQLVFLLMSERPGVFAAFAPVGIEAARQVAESLSVPTPVLYMIGRNEARWRLEDARLTVQAISRVNRSGDEREEWADNYILFRPMAGGADFIFNLHRAGHVWPTGASDQVMRFFRQYRLSTE